MICKVKIFAFSFSAIHRQIESTQVPSSIWAGYGFSQSMPAAFTTKERESLRYSSTSLEVSFVYDIIIIILL